MTRFPSMMMVLTAFALLYAPRSFGAPKKKNPLTEKEWMALREISKEEIKNTFKAFLKESANQKFPAPTALAPKTHAVELFCKHPFIEADTGFQLKWLEKVHEGMKVLIKIQSVKRMCKISGNKKVYAEQDAKFDAVRTKLEQLMKHPAKVPPKRLQALRKRALTIREAIKKKLAASGWTPPPGVENVFAPTPPPTSTAPKRK